ncbi:MAG: D-2-hydroxyacid dehydrogenase [Chloroflexota bacterium]|nr:D-2-hydroxyacid dehydrogenase [Chloroflexia bacterium]MDQ3227633.1 D-2-hydroxyacid dehydrogenase [Chloroflexota bacterium]
MKVVLTQTEGSPHFALLDDLDLPDVQIVQVSTPDELAAEIVDADVLYGFPTAALLRSGKALRWIQSPSAGVNYLQDLTELVENDIVLTNTRGAHGPSIGEHTFALLFALTRHIPASIQAQRDRYWARPELYRTSREVRGSTMGVIGFGAIGRAVAQRAKGFDMEVLAVDPHPEPGAPFVVETWGMERLPDLLQQSDVVVVAAPLTTGSYHLLDAAALAHMKPNAYLIVVSRGGIVDEDALVDALQNGKLAGAGIDVTEIEPLSPESRLWDAPNLIITPHTAGDSSEKERRCIEILRENLVRFSQGETLLNVVDKQRGY